MVAVSSTRASSSKNPRNREKCSSSTSWSVEGHALGVLQSRALLLVVEGTRGVLLQGEYLLVGDSQLTAHGSVQILSELAAVYGRDPPVDERDEPAVDEAGGVEPAPHGPRSPEDGRAPRVEQVVQEGRSPLLSLGLEDGLYRSLGAGGIYALDPCHSVTPPFLAMLPR